MPALGSRDPHAHQPTVLGVDVIDQSSVGAGIGSLRRANGGAYVCGLAVAPSRVTGRDASRRP